MSRPRASFSGSKWARRTGVYAIRNTVNGKCYIGSASFQFIVRWRGHRSKLRKGEHYNRILQRAWNKYGEESFVFEPIIICAPDDCIMYEQKCIDLYRCADGRHGYNCSPTAGSPRGVKHSAEARAKVSAANKGKAFSAETRAKIAAALTGNKNSVGRKPTPKMLAAMRAPRKPMTPEQRARVSEAHKGKTISAEQRAKISAAHKGKKQSAAHVLARIKPKGSWRHTPDAKEKMAARFRGGKHSSEHVAKCVAGRRAALLRKRQQKQRSQMELPI